MVSWSFFTHYALIFLKVSRKRVAALKVKLSLCRFREILLCIPNKHFYPLLTWEIIDLPSLVLIFGHEAACEMWTHPVLFHREERGVTCLQGFLCWNMFDIWGFSKEAVCALIKALHTTASCFDDACELK